MNQYGLNLSESYWTDGFILAFILIEIIMLIFIINLYREYPSIHYVIFSILGIFLLLIESVYQYIQLSMYDFPIKMNIFWGFVKISGAFLFLVGFILMIKKFIYLMNTDSLTNLYTRQYIEKCWSLRQKRSSWYKEKMSILFLDVNDFKQVNDKFGHEIGNQILTDLACTINSCVRKQGIVSRFGSVKKSMKT